MSQVGTMQYSDVTIEINGPTENARITVYSSHNGEPVWEDRLWHGESNPQHSSSDTFVDELTVNGYTPKVQSLLRLHRVDVEVRVHPNLHPTHQVAYVAITQPTENGDSE